jgi:hypothetical protein
MTGRRTELRIDGYVDSVGTIALPDEMTLVSSLLADHAWVIGHPNSPIRRAGPAPCRHVRGAATV